MAAPKKGNLKIRPIPIKTVAQITVRTFASWVCGLPTNTGIQTNVSAKEVKRRTRTHRLGRDVGFRRRQMRPLSNMLMDTDTVTNVKNRRKPSTARVALSTRKLWHLLP
jgi:hypothetical protein